jgi:hypothetical protein
MTTIKSYSDLQQSKKLAEILPIESADMYYFLDPTPAGNIYHIVTPQIDFGVKTKEPEYNKGDILAWSLAALLSVLPKIINNETLFIETSAALWHIGYRNIYTARADNPVDACAAMIEKLNELNLL